MNSYVVLLRGVNVGGNNLLPMKELKKRLENNGFEGVNTYIQSGNMVLRSAALPEEKIGSLIEKEFGFTTKVLSLSRAEFELSVENNPYQDYEGKFVHFYFCQEAPKLDLAKIDKYITSTERYKLVNKVFYLHAPLGIARSKIVANIEVCLGVSATGRNLNTVTKLNELISLHSTK